MWRAQTPNEIDFIVNDLPCGNHVSFLRFCTQTHQRTHSTTKQNDLLTKYPEADDRRDYNDGALLLLEEWPGAPDNRQPGIGASSLRFTLACVVDGSWAFAAARRRTPTSDLPSVS